MKKDKFLEVVAYGFVAIVFVIVISWLFNLLSQSASVSEPFAGCGGQEPSKDTQLVLDTSIGMQRPYVTTEMDMGDFEGDLDRTYSGKFEGGIQATKDVHNLAMRQYPFDWVNAPPSSKIFQEQNALFLEKENLLRNAEPLPVSYQSSMDINNARLMPPSQGKQTEGFDSQPNLNPRNHSGSDGFVNLGPADEIIKSYKPMCSTDKNKLSEDDAENFILSYYDKLGLVPEFNKRDDGVYEVVGTYEKNPKIVYEDEVQQNNDSIWKPMAGNDEITVNANFGKELAAVPSSAVLADKTTGKMRDDDSQGLQRMFGPGLQWQQYG